MAFFIFGTSITLYTNIPSKCC